MAWGDWLRRKASAVTEIVVRFVGAGKPVYTPRNFYNLAKEGFENNVYVYRAVMLIASACAGIPWVLYRKGRSRGTWIEEEDHPLLELIRRPNPEQGQAQFIRQLVAYWILAGNSYVEAVTPNTRKAPPVELWVLRPDRVKVIPDSKNRVGGYEYRAGIYKHEFTREQIMHLKMFSATDDWYGLSPIVVAARIIDQNNAADDWNFSLLKNMARPPLAFVTETKLDDNQFKRLKERIEKKWAGAENAGKPILLENGMDVKELSFSPQDMDWIKGDIQHGRKIALALGVPPELLGDSTNKTYSNYREARAAFYEETVIPLMDELRDELNNWLVPKFDDRLFLDYDRDEIEALQEERNQVAERMQKSWWLTINEKRRAMGYEDIEGGDELYIPANLMPVSAMNEGDEPFGPRPEEGDE